LTAAFVYPINTSMNIQELDAYNLDDAVKFNDRLNPRLWDKSEHLRDDVRAQLLLIAEDFRESLGVKDLDLQDITISGSNAAYTYTPNSDIDLHLVVAMPEDPVYRELFDAKKFQYNETHTIKIGGYDVELYVQAADQPHYSQGIYSVLNNDWIQVPRRARAAVDDASTRNKFETIGHQIEAAIKSGDRQRLDAMAEKIKRMRQTGLEQHGEFGPENLAFKILRSQGVLQKLHDARAQARSQELSLKEQPAQPRFTWGFQSEDAGLTWDGVNPTTCMFLNEEDPEPTDEEILRDFIDFCAKELNIDTLPTVKLRRDPQWPVVNKTFGRYRNDLAMLEVAWGQRHIMDVLRTVAHELTHRHQHERDGEEMDHTAGETGSPWENEANARAGILMRDYAQLHPDYFEAGQEEHIDEGIKSTAAVAAVVAALSGAAPAQAQVQDIIGAVRDIGSIAIAAKKITRAGLNAEAQQELNNYLSVSGDRNSRNLSVIYQLQQRLEQQAEQPTGQPLPGYTQQANPATNEASGYIPTKKQAKDPRFSTALTVDIKPGQLGKEANKLNLKTNKQGIPQVANPNGLFEKLSLELAKFKKSQADEDYSADAPPGPEFKPTMPAGTLRVDVSDVYDWYKIGQHISNMKGLGKHDFGQGPPSSIISFGDEDTEHEFIGDLKATGLDVTDIDPKDPKKRPGRTIKTDPTYNVTEAFDQPYPLTWEKSEADESVDALARLPDGSNLSIMFNQDLDDEGQGIYSVEFWRDNSQEVSGAGDSHRVFATVLAAIAQFIEKRKPEQLYFSANKDVEPGQKSGSRSNLYTTLVRRYANALGYQADISDFAGSTTYKLNQLYEQELNEDEDLDEVKMSPTALRKFADSPAAKGIMVGFEAELIVPDVNTGDDDREMEPDYDADERCTSIQQVIEFFEYDEWGYGISGREAERLQEQLDETYYEWYDEQMMRDFKEEAEDLIKKVMIDEKDWDEDNEIQKQLELLDLSTDEMNAIINAGERAPKFTTSREQQAYSEANPAYQKYLDAQEEAEGLLDELVQDSVRAQDKYWDAAIDDFRDNYQINDDSGFFDDVDLRWMSDVANRFNLSWPYITFSEGSGSLDIDSVAADLSKALGMPVVASYSYHGAQRKPGQFIIEPDGSLSPDNSEDGGLEIISPPMPIAKAMQKLQAVIDWAQARGCYTNSSTGLHMGVSLPGQRSFAEADGDVETASATEKPIDFMKLALFLGDQYVLKDFGRSANNYCRSSLEKLKEKRWSPTQIATAMEKMRGNLINLAYKDLADRSPGRDSINMKDNYVEFRGAGGDYLSRESDEGTTFLENTLLRYVQALAIAGDPNAYRDEYAKKLYKLISPEGDNTLDLFSKFATGEIDKEKLKTEWARKTLSKDDPGSVDKSNWVLVNIKSGQRVPGAEYSGYTKPEAYALAREKYGGSLSQTMFDMQYEIEPQNSGRWEIYRDDQGQEEQLEIIDSPTRGGAVDQAYDTYTGVIPFKVRPYYGNKEAKPEPTRRAKLAKQIIQKPAQPKDYNYEIVNLGDVNLGVVDKFYATNKQDADATFDKWLEMKGLPNDTSNYGYRPRKQEKEVDVAQNFSTNPNPTAPIANQARMPNGVPVWLLFDIDTGSMLKEIPDHTAREAYQQGMIWLRSIGAEDPETYGERFAIKPKIVPQDATEQEGTWQIFDATLRQPVETFQGTWAQADSIARQYETGPGERNGHEISVRRAQ
jgi:hypothetical protein